MGNFYIVNIAVNISYELHLGTPFAIQTTDGHYIPQSNNSYFYTDTTLVCVTDYETEVYWFYQRGFYDVKKSLISNTADGGISTYGADIINPGFYTCEVSYEGSTEAYIAGIFSNMNNSGKFSYFYSIIVI